MYSMTQRRQRRIFVVGVWFLCSLMVLGGCEPLRKKFTRKKRKDRGQVEEIPVLEPIEYPAKVHTPQELYRHHFSLWQVWNKELIAALAVGESKKRVAYQTAQAIMHLEELKKLVADDAQQLLDASLATLYRLREDLDAPMLTKSFSSWEVKVRSLERKIRATYSVSNIEKNIKK